MTIAALRLEGAALTDVGRVREANEDSYCARPEVGLWAVADGMGGHERGEWASAAICNALQRIEIDGTFDAALATMAAAIHEANGEIYTEASSLGQQMGSTVVAILLRERSFGVLWAGDSRAYLLRGGRLHRLTRDHTQVQELVDRGILTPEAAAGHPMGHVLARAVGVRDALELDAVADEMLPGDVFLLCSDGLTGVLDEQEIARLLGPDMSGGRPEPLVELCLERGAPDNVTVVTVTASEPTLLRFVTPIGGDRP